MEKTSVWKKILNEIYLIAPNKYTEDNKFNRNTENHPIAKKFNLKSQDFSEGVSFLEEQGLIETKRHPNYRWWVLTEKGFNVVLENEKNRKQEKINLALTNATVVLALVGFIQTILYFKQFSKEVNDWVSWLILVIIGVVIFLIFNLSYESFNHLLDSKKSPKHL